MSGRCGARGEGVRYMGIQIHSVSLVTSTATARFGLAPLSLVAGPVSTASFSGTSNKTGDLDCSVWAVTSVHPSSVRPSIHPSVHPISLPPSFAFLPQHSPFQNKTNKDIWCCGFSWRLSHSPLSQCLTLCYQPITTGIGRWTWRREVGGLTGGWRTHHHLPNTYSTPGSVPITPAG